MLGQTVEGSEENENEIKLFSQDLSKQIKGKTLNDVSKNAVHTSVNKPIIDISVIHYMKLFGTLYVCYSDVILLQVWFTNALL